MLPSAELHHPTSRQVAPQAVQAGNDKLCAALNQFYIIAVTRDNSSPDTLGGQQQAVSA